MARQAAPNLTLPAQFAAGAGRAGTVADNWLASWNDPALDALVGEALSFNADLRLAAVRVDQAVAYLHSAAAPGWPQVNLVARGGGKMSGDGSGLQGVGFFASWELDLWGRVRAEKTAAESAVRSDASRRRVRAPIDRRAGHQGVGARDRGAARKGAGRADARARRSSSCTWRATASV